MKLLKPLLLFSFFICIYTFSFAQGTIRGKISDENGAPLIGVNVILKENSNIGAATDFDGNYSLTIPDAASYTLMVNYISYESIEEPVPPVKGVVIKNFGMKQAGSQTIKEVVVTGKATKAKEYYVEKMKRNSATTIDYVSSETMKKTGDATVTAAITRASGVTTYNDGFFTVRGMGDRYVKTTINGSRIPTLDPFTNNIKLDMFPANLVDNVIR